MMEAFKISIWAIVTLAVSFALMFFIMYLRSKYSLFKAKRIMKRLIKNADTPELKAQFKELYDMIKEVDKNEKL